MFRMKPIFVAGNLYYNFTAHCSHDQITIVKSPRKLFGLFFVAIFFILLGVLWIYSDDPPPIDASAIFVLILLIGPISLLFILCQLYFILFSGSVIIDKKSQSIIIKKESYINRFNSIKEVPFANLENIVIQRTKADFWYRDDWAIRLNTRTYGEWIYITDSESEAEKIAERISKITGNEEIFHEVVERDYPGG